MRIIEIFSKSRPVANTQSFSASYTHPRLERSAKPCFVQTPKNVFPVPWPTPLAYRVRLLAAGLLGSRVGGQGRRAGDVGWGGRDKSCRRNKSTRYDNDDGAIELIFTASSETHSEERRTTIIHSCPNVYTAHTHARARGVKYLTWTGHRHEPPTRVTGRDPME